MTKVNSISQVPTVRGFNGKLTCLGQAMLSASKFISSYSRYDEETKSYETWPQAVERVMVMHREKYAEKMTPELAGLLAEAQEAYASQLVLGAQRALQFGGDQLRKHEAKMYNCVASYADRPAFFHHAMYLMLCGDGVGFSVQKRHVDKLPAITARDSNKVMEYVIEDSIEGWSNAIGILLSSFLVGGGSFPEYAGSKVHFDYSKIRPKGAKISGGFKAPGPEPLRDAITRCEALLNRELTLAGGDVKMRPIVVYDFVMHMSNAVLAGGVRRSATLCLFDKDDLEMLSAKSWENFRDNPQRARSNNSAIIKRDEITPEEWAVVGQHVRDFGEPGFVFVNDLDVVFNPCVEIGMRPVTIRGISGFQFCNLVEINGAQCTDEETFLRACRAAAILATVQAGYTDFKYLDEATKEITEREALIGVSITGWMNNPHVLFDEALLKKGAEIVKATNREVAALIGINPAARTTCGKPAGNASTLLGTAAGIHADHAPRYIRNMQMNNVEDIAQLLKRVNPEMVEPMFNSEKTDVVVSFPIEAPANSIFRQDMMGVKMLERVRFAQQHWVENGTNIELCTAPHLRHNISNTITVDDWDAVLQYIYDNRQWFAGVSLLSAYGDKDYAQAPYTEVHTAEELVQMYGVASMFASGLIVDGKHAFSKGLWAACTEAERFAVRLTPELLMAAGELTEETLRAQETLETVLQRDWVRRAHKFAVKYFNGNFKKATYCLKDVHNLHRWEAIARSIKEVDFNTELGPKSYVDINTLGAQACNNGVCELTL